MTFLACGGRWTGNKHYIKGGLNLPDVSEMKLLLFVGAVACLHLASFQSCTRESLDNAEVVRPLLGLSLQGAGIQSLPPPLVMVENSTVVCLAVDSRPTSGGTTMYRDASLVVEYNCSFINCPGSYLASYLNFTLHRAGDLLTFVKFCLLTNQHWGDITFNWEDFKRGGKGQESTFYQSYFALLYLSPLYNSLLTV